jgi:hypothetical protein
MMEKIYIVFVGICLAGMMISFGMFVWGLVPDMGKTTFKRIKVVRWTKKFKVRLKNGRFTWIRACIIWK